MRRFPARDGGAGSDRPRTRRARLRSGPTPADLAVAVGRTQGWVSKVEKGGIELDRTTIINQLAAVLHCHPNALMERPYVAVRRQ